MVLSSPQHSRHSHLKKLGAQNVCYFTSKARGKARNELSRPQPGTPIPPPPGWLISGNGIGIDAVYPKRAATTFPLVRLPAVPIPAMLSQGVATVALQAYDVSFALLEESGLMIKSGVP